MKLSELAQYLELTCESDIEITAINTLKDAQEGELSFLDNPKYLQDLSSTKASAVLLQEKYLDQLPLGVVGLATDEPYLKLALSTKLFAPAVIEAVGSEPIIHDEAYVSSKAYVGKNSEIGEGAQILPGAFIGDNVKIGANTIIHPNVAVYRDCVVGKNCIIHANTAIGSDGFGFAHTKQGEHVKIYQNGNVIIEDDVEIGSNTSVDCAVFGSTLIKRGSKIDNLIQIGHNCEIGEHCIIAGQTGISGSTKLGRNVVLGAQSGTVGHIEIAPFTTVAARGGVTKTIKESGKTFSGFPLMEHRLWLKLQGKLAKLLK